MNSDPIQLNGDAIIDLTKSNAKYLVKSDAKMLLVLKSIEWLFVHSVCLFFLPSSPSCIPSSKLWKSRGYKENSNISQGYEEGEKNFCIGNVIFIRFSLRATKYCRCIAGRVGRNVPWRSVFQIKNLLNLTDIHLLSNLSQQFYYEMNIKQQQNTSSNCFQLIMAFLGSRKLTTAALSPVPVG